MQLSHLNYIRPKDKYFLSEISMEVHNNYRTIFNKFSFVHLAAIRRDVNNLWGTKASWTPKIKGKIWRQGHWGCCPLIRHHH